jgi:hypothetical protein
MGIKPVNELDVTLIWWIGETTLIEDHTKLTFEVSSFRYSSILELSALHFRPSFFSPVVTNFGYSGFRSIVFLDVDCASE